MAKTRIMTSAALNSACRIQTAAIVQVAVIAQDESALLDGCVRLHNALVPLLATPRPCSHVLPAIVAASTLMQNAANLIQDSFDGQEASRRAAARALAALTLHGVQMAVRDGEVGIARELAALKPLLFSAYDPHSPLAGRHDAHTCADARCCFMCVDAAHGWRSDVPMNSRLTF